MKAADSLTLEFTCVESRSSESGHRARLVIPLPPPKPVQDGYGNHIAHPNPGTGALSLFVTSDKRQEIFYQIEPLERQKKPLRPALAVDDNHRKAIEAERAELDKKIDALRVLYGDCNELQFEHGAVYEVTIRKKAAGKVGK
jgi:hypothetical protein